MCVLKSNTYRAAETNVGCLGTVGRQFWRTGGYRRQCLTMADGGLIALDWFGGCDTDGSIARDAPIMMVFHGLTGGHWVDARLGTGKMPRS